MKNRFNELTELLMDLTSQAAECSKEGRENLCYGIDAEDVAAEAADCLDRLARQFRALSQQCRQDNEVALAYAVADCNVPEAPGYYVIEDSESTRPFMIVERTEDGSVKYAGSRFADRAVAEEDAEIRTEEEYEV